MTPTHGTDLESLARWTPVPLIWLGACLVGLVVIPRLSGGDQTIVGSALAIDLVVVAPLLAYVLLVRAHRAKPIVLAPLLLVGFVLASTVIVPRPAGTLAVLEVVVLGVEIGVVVALLVMARRALAGSVAPGGDLFDRVRAGAESLVGRGRASGVFATEASIIAATLGFGRARSEDTEHVWTMHRSAGYLPLLVTMLAMLPIETLVVHLVVSLVSHTAAWVLTALSLYTGVWLVGDYRAWRNRRTELSGGELRLRVGVRAEARVPLSQIESVECGRYPLDRESSFVRAIVWGDANIRLRTQSPVRLTRMYGMSAETRELEFRVDEPERLRDEIMKRIGE